MLERRGPLRGLDAAFAGFSAVAILGPRQIGKTTLARQFAERLPGPVTRFDLEDARDVARLEDPLGALEPLRGLVVLDEIQRRPEIFPALRVLLDRPDNPARFLILGSASPELLRQSSETLAGRIAYRELGGLDVEDTGSEALLVRWLRGGFPRSFLAPSDARSFAWRREFVRTFLERDLPQLGVRLPAPTLGRFWGMTAHLHGQLWNHAEMARAFGGSAKVARSCRDLLEVALVLRVLRPWSENLGKRQVKTPRVYLRDSGLLHYLLDVRTPEDLDTHPKVGASFEGFAIHELIAHLDAHPEECYFWRAHTGAEVDLLIVRGRERRAFEIKRTSAPRTTRSMHTAVEDLRLDRLDVIHGGRDTYPLRDRIRAVSIFRLREDVEV
jgi:hypothetical protein